MIERVSPMTEIQLSEFEHGVDIGRGGLWTPDEIKLMADYLGDALGPDVKPIEPAK